LQKKTDKSLREGKVAGGGVKQTTGKKRRPWACDRKGGPRGNELND